MRHPNSRIKSLRKQTQCKQPKVFSFRFCSKKIQVQNPSQIKVISAFWYLRHLGKSGILKPSPLNQQPGKKKNNPKCLTSHFVSNKISLKCKDPFGGLVVLVVVHLFHQGNLQEKRVLIAQIMGKDTLKVTEAFNSIFCIQ